MRVLVAVDRSEEAERALRYSCELLAGTSAWVLALHVKPNEETITPQHFLYPTMDRIDVIERIDSDAEQVKEGAMERCDACSPGKVPCWARVVAGEPAEEILEAADMGQYDLIVLGAHGRSALAGLLLGTIHSKILHLTRHPVLLVRESRPLRRVLVVYRGTRCDQ
ncbi:MAG: universal stress protein, partial [Acidobacteriota bacterium]